MEVQGDESDDGSISDGDEDFYDGEAARSDGSCPSVDPEDAADDYERRKPYSVLTPLQLRAEWMETCLEAKAIICVDVCIAHALLVCYTWKVQTLAQDMLDDPVRASKKANLSHEQITREPPPAENHSEMFCCEITADEVPYEETDALPCGHRFSDGCWETFLRVALESGEKVMQLRCPQFECGFPVLSRLWEKYLPRMAEDGTTRYETRAVDDYVNSQPDTKWCPGADCPNAVRVNEGSDSVSKSEVTCDCGMSFCFFCSDEPHRPVSCEIIRKWHLKNQDEAENIQWILVHTKNCPQCKRPIEKNHGCMHMTCRCSYEFCWLCMAPWRHHGGDAYRCNIYEVASMDPQQEERKRAKESLERYAHFFERYRTHHHGQKVASEKLLQAVREHMTALHPVVGDVAEVTFLEESVRRVILCRRMLKWSYAYAYFARWEHSDKALFEHHQGQLESTLDSLQESIQRFHPNSVIGEDVASFEEFFTFKSKLVNLTRVVKDFFAKMSETFETDFRVDETQQSQ